METVPLSSVDCERVFSAMNYIKDKRKSALTTKHLAYKIALKMHGPNVKNFDYNGAFEIWKS